jgi:DNA-binding MarR family transcriptional regulator
MSTSTPSRRAAASGYGGDETLTPMIGVLLRLPHEAVVARIQAAVAEAGFDIAPNELGLFLYPGPDGRRPSDLARRCRMTRQSMNYLLSGLEARGYLQRHDAEGHAGRVVRLTAKGRKVIAPVREAVVAVEREWAEHLGHARFEALRQTLRDLATHLGTLD